MAKTKYVERLVKIKYEAWRRLVVRQSCIIEIEVHDFIANDPYATDSAMNAYIKQNEDTIEWKEDSVYKENSGHNRITDEREE